MSLKDDLVDIAAGQVGIHEVGGNNLGPQVRVYQQATWLAPGAWPWCAAFTAWCLREWLGRADLRRVLGIGSMEQAEQWRCRDASAYGWEKWATQRHLLLLDESAPAQAGDFCTFDFSHIGIVRADQGATIQTIEGNTNGAGDRDSEGGDGVWRKSRARHLIKSFIRVLP